MTPTARFLAALGAAAAFLYLGFYYVPISTGHTQEIFALRPLGDWRIDSGGLLALYYGSLLAGLFALYAWAARRLAKLPAEPLGARAAVYAGAAAAVTILTFSPSLLSKDIFDYMVQGRMLALYKANPFQVPPDAFPPDEFIRAMGWPQFTTLYGPGWISTCALVAWLAPPGLAGSLVLYKAIFGAAHLLGGLLVGSILKSWGRPRLLGEMLFLWNPLVLLQVSGQGHNDGFLMLWVLLGLWFAQKRTPVRSLGDDLLATICMTVSILTKYITAPVLALFVALRFRERRGGGGPWRACILALAAVAVLLVGYLPYIAGMNVLYFLRPYQHGAYQGSALMLLDMVVKKIFPADARGVYPEAVADIMQGAGGLLLLGLALAGLVLLFRLRREEDLPRYALGVLLAYLLVATALLRTSYGVWIVPLAALAAPGPARRTAFVASATLLSLELYWVYAIRLAAAAEPIEIHRERALATLVAVGVPISYLLAGFVRRRFGPRSGRA